MKTYREIDNELATWEMESRKEYLKQETLARRLYRGRIMKETNEVWKENER